MMAKLPENSRITDLVGLGNNGFYPVLNSPPDGPIEPRSPVLTVDWARFPQDLLHATAKDAERSGATAATNAPLAARVGNCAWSVSTALGRGPSSDGPFGRPFGVRAALTW